MRNRYVTLLRVDAAHAIADPVRRDIIAMLHRQGRTPAGAIAERFAISRPAVSRHLRLLREAGLVHVETEGRHQLYTLDPGPLSELSRWLARFTTPTGWHHRFDALDTEVRRTRRDRARQGSATADAAHTGVTATVTSPEEDSA